MKKYLLSAFVMLGVLLSSCNNNRIFEENKDFENNAWPISAIQKFKFEVKDPSKKHAIYFNVRNAVFYEYYNLYLKHILIGPDGKEISTNLHELFLMDKQT